MHDPQTGAGDRDEHGRHDLEHGHHEHGRHEHGHHLSFDSPETAEQAELEGESFLPLTAEAVARVAACCAGGGIEVRRVLDLGSGPGVGSTCLAQQFGGAAVVAVDGSAAMLQRAATRAERLGVADRMSTRLVEFPDGLDALGHADVAWISMALHHVGDEIDALHRIRRLLEPDGVLAVIEFAEPMRVLPDDVELGRPGLWTRLDEAWARWFADMRADLPGATSSSDHAGMLVDAGFELLTDEVIALDIDAPLDEAQRRFARTHVERARVQLDGYADPEDLAVLDALIDEGAATAIMRRDDAVVTASRRLSIARVAAGAAGTRS